MKKKITNNKSSNKNTIEKMKKNDPNKKKTSTPDCKVKSPSKSLKYQKQKSSLRIKISTPPLVSRISKVPIKTEDLCKQDCLKNEEYVRLTQDQLTKESHIKSHKLLFQNIYHQKASDYLQLTPQKLKSEIKWANKNETNSSVNEQICHEYGYSNLSNAMIKSLKNQRDPLKKQKNKSEKQDIQRLMTKYRKHIDKDDSSRGSTKSKDKNFRTLSTDDKSQKRLHFTKSNKNIEKSKLNKIVSKFPQKKNKLSEKKNISLTKKKKKTKTLLPDYFGCLSINKVESQLQTLKSKEQKFKNKIKTHIDSNQTTTDRFKEESIKKPKVFSARSSSSNFMRSQSKKVSPFKKKTSGHLISNNLKQMSQRSSKKV